MLNMDAFNQMFKSPKSKKMGIKLKRIVESYFDQIEESIVGGAKVKLALYSRDGKDKVLCGIQEGSNDSCMFYVHHVDDLKHERLKFSGKGKHAKRIKFNEVQDILEDDINWLLSKVIEKTPF